MKQDDKEYIGALCTMALVTAIAIILVINLIFNI